MKPLCKAWMAVLLAVSVAMPTAFAQPARIGAGVGSASALRVDAFDVEQVSALGPGTPLHFSLYGSAGGDASLRIDGVDTTVALREVDPGVYEGTHRIRDGDRIGPDSRVVADLHRAGESARVVLEEPLMIGAPMPTPTPAHAHACPDCARVESIRTVQERDAPGVIGAVTGGVLGAIVGHRIGRGDGRTAAGILGAVGGAMVGREIERQRSVRLRYEVAVRRADGVLESRRYDGPPPFQVGDRVRVARGAWLPEPQP